MSIDDLIDQKVQAALTRALAQQTPVPAAVPTSDEDGVFTVEDLAQYLQIGRNAAYALVHSAEFTANVRVTKIGNRIVIPRWHVRRWLDQGADVTPALMPAAAQLRLTDPVPSGARQRKASGLR